MNHVQVDTDEEKYSYRRFVRARSFRLGLLISVIVVFLIIVILAVIIAALVRK